MPEVSLGVDLGSTGLRAAWTPPGGTPRFSRMPAALWPWPLCEPSPSRTGPPVFSSLKDRLADTRPVATDTDGRPLVARELVTVALRALRAQVEADTSEPVGQTVVAVPARFESTQRTALRDAAYDAGLERTRLISDSVAAVVGHTRGTDSGTFLVYGMGSAGFELGLVRAAQGHYRALAYEGGAAPGGRSLDAELLNELLRVLGSHPDSRTELAGTARWEAADWQALRARTERVKEELGGEPTLHGPPSLLTLHVSGQGAVEFTKESFHRFLGARLDRVASRVDTLLADGGLTAETLDAVLLTGGSTRLAAVRGRAERPGVACVPGPPELIGRGAAAYAEILSRSAGPPPDDRLGVAPPETGGYPAGGRDGAGEASSGLVATVVRARRADPAAAPPVAQQVPPPEPVPQPEPQPEPPPVPEPPAPVGGPEPLARARALLAKKQYAHAVQESHLAWQARPEQPDIFEGMIDVHCQAALAADGPEHAGHATRWLECAYQHDRTNVRLRELLAEHLYQHALALQQRGRTAEAVTALERCVGWGPEHRAAYELLARLTRQRPGG